MCVFTVFKIHNYTEEIHDAHKSKSIFIHVHMKNAQLLASPSIHSKKESNITVVDSDICKPWFLLGLPIPRTASISGGDSIPVARIYGKNGVHLLCIFGFSPQPNEKKNPQNRYQAPTQDLAYPAKMEGYLAA